MSKLREIINKGIYVYVIIIGVLGVLALVAFFWFVIPGSKISAEELFSPQLLLSIIIFLSSICGLIFLYYFWLKLSWFQLKKYRETPEREQKVEWKGQNKIIYILYPSIAVGLFVIFLFGGLNLGTIVAMILVTVVLFGISLGIKQLIKKSEKSAEQNNLLKWVIAAIVIVFVLLAPSIARSIYVITSQSINDPSDISECFSIIRKESMRKSCIYRHIVNTNNLALCNSVEDKQIQKNIAKNNNFYFVKKDDCLLEVAKNLNDASICDSILSNNVRNSCMARIAENTLNISLCKMVQNVKENGQTLHLRDGCLLRIAKELKDSAICELIEDLPYSNIRQECILETKR